MTVSEFNRGSLGISPWILAAVAIAFVAGPARGEEPSFSALSYTRAHIDNGAVDGELDLISIYSESRLTVPWLRLVFSFSVGDGAGPLGDDRDVYAARGGLKVQPWAKRPLRLSAGYQAGSVGLPDVETGNHLTLFGSDSSWTGGISLEWEEIKWIKKFPVPAAFDFHFTGPGKPPTFARGRGLCFRIGPLQYCVDETSRDIGGKGKAAAWTWGHKLGEPWPWHKGAAAEDEQLKRDRLARFIPLGEAMRPIAFEQANGTLTGGPAESFGTGDDVADLPVYRDEAETISCWKASFKERLRVLFTGRVWLRSASQTHPPVSVEGVAPWA